MLPSIKAIGISSHPLRIYVSTREGLQVFKVKPGAKVCCVLQCVGNIEKIRFEQGLLILCSPISVAGFRFQETLGRWYPEFLIKVNTMLDELKSWLPGRDINGNSVLDARLVYETKLLVLSKKEKVLWWQVYDCKELAADYLIAKKAVIFQPRYYWSQQGEHQRRINVLDTSCEGLCLISSDESDIWVLDLMKKGDNPASGWAGNSGENNCSGYGYFLRSCGVPGHQTPFIFCGRKYLEWALCQKFPNHTENLSMNERIKEVESNKDKHWAAKRPLPSDQLRENYVNIAGWQSEIHEEFPSAFPLCYHYSSGLAFVWNSKALGFLRQKTSAVILLEYTEEKGNCRLYKGSTYIDGHYIPTANTWLEEELHESPQSMTQSNSSIITTNSSILTRSSSSLSHA